MMYFVFLRHYKGMFFGEKMIVEKTCFDFSHNFVEDIISYSKKNSAT